jgi:hypothetical protein
MLGTKIGRMGLTLPEKYNPQILEEMKEIVAGIQLQKK